MFRHAVLVACGVVIGLAAAPMVGAGLAYIDRISSPVSFSARFDAIGSSSHYDINAPPRRPS